MVTMTDKPTEHLIDWAAHVWTADDTKEYLDSNPLPVGFTWKHKDGEHRLVQPSYKIESYGKWLRESPNFQGLFEEIHRLIVAQGSRLPDIDTVAAELVRRWPKRDFTTSRNN